MTVEVVIADHLNKVDTGLATRAIAALNGITWHGRELKVETVS